jgi:hypothetical protein
MSFLSGATAQGRQAGDTRAVPSQTLVIRIYDSAGLSWKETARLTETAGRVFRQSGIHVAWLYCNGVMAEGPGGACGQRLEFSQISVRLHGGAPPTAESNRKLGRALVGAGGGYFATVYVPLVRGLAGEWGLDFGLLMGYRVAHEAGHCLLGPGHSGMGLMRAVWTPKDAREMAQGDLGLTTQEAQRAARKLATSGPLQLADRR